MLSIDGLVDKFEVVNTKVTKTFRIGDLVPKLNLHLL